MEAFLSSYSIKGEFLISFFFFLLSSPFPSELGPSIFFTSLYFFLHHLDTQILVAHATNMSSRGGAA